MRLRFPLQPMLALVAACGALAVMPAPAAAQDQGGDRVNTLIIYGDDECPPSAEGEIVVCARMDEGERYRIPERLRQSQDPANEAWASRVQSYETVGNFGPLSCTPVGAGGELGCTAEMIEAAYAERAQSSNVRFSLRATEALAREGLRLVKPRRSLGGTFPADSESSSAPRSLALAGDAAAGG